MSILVRFILPVFFLIYSNSIYCQGEQEFIKNYNEHIDPFHKLDTLKVFVRNENMVVSGFLNSQIIDIKKSNSCKYYSDGTENCVDSKTGSSLDLSLIEIQPASSKNIIKYHLNFITLEDGKENLKFKLVNDSITVIEEDEGAVGKRTYTFDSKTRDLLQLECKRIVNNITRTSLTRFDVYETINGIIVPQKASYSNDYCQATVEYANLYFK